MMKRFVKNRYNLYDLSIKRFNHSSCVCPYDGHVLIAWYSGTHECGRDQRVYIMDPITGNEPIHLDNGTGNPVMWNEGASLWMVYSKYTGKRVNSAHEWWGSCDLMLQKLAYHNKIEFIGAPERLASCGILARCRPIVIDRLTYLPLYDENSRECVIYRGSFGSYSEWARFGTNVIQPTIWWEDKLNVLCRNFGSGGGLAPHYIIDNDGSLYSSNISGFQNFNNSLHVIKLDDDIVAVWNAGGKHRDKLVLGMMRDKNPALYHRVMMLDEMMGAYPSMAVDNDILHISFTNHNYDIRYITMSKEYFYETARRSERARNRNLPGRGRGYT